MSQQPYPFNLDVAIATWRHVMKHDRSMMPEDLDELERHVRDQTAWLTAEGLNEEEAYRKTMQEMGDQGSVQKAYRDVFWIKVRHKSTLKDELWWRLAMLHNYGRITFRNLKRNGIYSAVTIAGLAVGLAVFLLIGLFVQYEHSYDRFHADADRIYRVTKLEPGNVYLGKDEFALTPVPLPMALEQEIPGIEAATQISPLKALLGVTGELFEEDGHYATASFFNVFSYDVLDGNPDTMLRGPNRIVLTRSLAHQLFGQDDPLGKIVSFTYFDTSLDLEVSGLLEDPPENAHFTFRYLILMETDRWWHGDQDQWNNSDRYTYFKASGTVSREQLAQTILAMGIEKLKGLEWYIRNPEAITQFQIQPLVDIHLHSNINFELQANGSMRYVWIFSSIAVFILLIACVNYMNLATARSATRSREIGIRQVSGARPGQLIQ